METISLSGSKFNWLRLEIGTLLQAVKSKHKQRVLRMLDFILGILVLKLLINDAFKIVPKVSIQVLIIAIPTNNRIENN